MTGDEYRMFRESLNMTQGELAQELGVELNTVSRRELGQIQVSTEAEIAIRHVAALRRQKPKYSLRQHPVARFRVGEAVGKGRVFQYRIEGLPPGHEAFIAEFPHRGWKLLRSIHGQQGNWYGQFKSSEEALFMLQKEYDNAPEIEVTVWALGDGLTRGQVRAISEQAIGSRPGNWKVSLKGSQSNDRWEGTVEGPRGFIFSVPDIDPRHDENSFRQFLTQACAKYDRR